MFFFLSDKLPIKASKGANGKIPSHSRGTPTKEVEFYGFYVIYFEIRDPRLILILLLRLRPHLMNDPTVLMKGATEQLLFKMQVIVIVICILLIILNYNSEKYARFIANL
jgi:hypothetical protein